MENWKLFLDDCGILLNTNKKEPTSLLEILNSIHPAIQFTINVSENNLPFLENMIHIDVSKIWMHIYSKIIGSKKYVSFYSKHPKNCLNNSPSYLARRICTIVENFKITKFELEELKTLLISQKYSKEIVTKGIK